MAYSYEPVTLDPLELRLVTVDPVIEGEHQVSISLRHVSLSANPRYYALSYTWGRPTFDFPGLFPVEWDDESATVTILVNGKEFPIRRNLHSALYTFRQNWKPDTLWWIDAICINQQNIHERNLLVQRMTEIYAKSQGSVIWLGLPDGTTHSAFLKIAETTESLESRSEALRQLHITQDASEQYREIIEKEFTGDAWQWFWNALKYVFRRSWWERAWVLQEVCVAPGAVLVCGDCVMPWTKVMEMRFAIVQHCVSTQSIEVAEKETIQETVLELLTATEPASSMEKCIQRYYKKRSAGQHPSLLWNLVQLRRTLSKDPRDKVYAAFGISDPEEVIDVDYSLPVRDVYAAVARRCIRVLDGLQILAYCKFPPLVDGLPSWVPDWSDRSAIHRIAFHNKGDGYVTELTQRFYAAAGSSTLNVQFQDEGLALMVKGFSIGQVGFTSSEAVEQKSHPDGDDQRPQGSKTTFNDVVHSYGWLREWFESRESLTGSDFALIHCRDPNGQDEDSINQIFDEAAYRPTNEPLKEAYLRTLSCDAVYLEDDKRHVRISQFANDDLNTVISKLWSLPNVLVEKLGGRALGVSEHGLLALIPTETNIGDHICFVEGSELPFILRPTVGGCYLIGECYVHGLMDGEIWNGCEERSVFKII